jgi:cytosine deaminase
LHADENMRTDSSDLEHLADIVIRDNVSHQMNASHCVSLSTRSEYDIDRIAAKVATAKITITALPQTNLFLQERGVSTNPARAITPIHRLQQAGVVVAAGADNLQDPFNLVGRGDPLEIASLLMISAHSTAVHRIHIKQFMASPLRWQLVNPQISQRYQRLTFVSRLRWGPPTELLYMAAS